MDTRAPDLLRPGDQIITSRNEIYTILKGAVGLGGSGVVYPARRDGSDIHYVLKESFPAPDYAGPGIAWSRRGGAVVPASGSPAEQQALLRQNRERFAAERQINEQVGNNTGHTIRIFDLPAVTEILHDGRRYTARQGDFDPAAPLFLRMDTQIGRGRFLAALLADCRQPPGPDGARFPLRTGGLPSAYTTARIMEEVLQAIQSVHAAGYLHGDIQNHNFFFLDPKPAWGALGHCCLLDFGAARPLEPDGKTPPVADKVLYTTSGFTPPEFYSANDGTLRLTPASDLYSAGRLMLWLLTGQLYCGREEQTFYLSSYLHRISRAVQCPPEGIVKINEVLSLALRINPADRYQSAAEMLHGHGPNAHLPCIDDLLNLLRPPKYRLGLQVSTLPEGAFQGREPELQEIGSRLASGQKPVVLWGFGGMGKTELAIEYGRRRLAQEAGQVYFVRFAGSFADTLTGPVADTASGYSKIDPITQKAKPKELVLEEILNHLKELGPDDLLIIDNVDKAGSDFAALTAESAYTRLCSLPVRLLLTTRSEQEGQMEVRSLDLQALRAIMRKFYPAEDQTLDPLIEAVGRHTLTVEIMARMLKADRQLTPQQLLARLHQTGALNRPDDIPVATQKDRSLPGAGEKRRIYEHLRILFDCTGLSDQEKMLLRHAFLIPDQGMDSILFCACEERAAAAALDHLIQLGWVHETQAEERVLTLHPLVQEVVWNELKPAPENCEGFLQTLCSQYDTQVPYMTKAYNARHLAQIASCLVKAVNLLSLTAPLKTHYLDKIGFLLGELGDFNNQLASYQNTLNIREKILPPDHLELAVNYDNISHSWGELGNHPRQLEFCLKALKIFEKVLPPDHPNLAISYGNTGAAWGNLGNYQKQLAFYQKALEIWEKILPPDHPDLAASYNNMGAAWGRLGNYQKQLAFCQQALEIREKILPPNHPDLAISYNNVGAAWGRLGNYQNQLAFCLKALEIRKKILPPDHPALAVSCNNIGDAWGSLGNYQNQLAFYQKALEIREKILPPDHPDLTTSYNNLGVAWGKLGNYQKQLVFYQKALEIQKKILPPEHPILAVSYNNVGIAWGNLGNYKKQLGFCQISFSIQKRKLPPGHPLILKTLENLIDACDKLGDLEQKAKYQEELDAALRSQDQPT